MLPTTPLLAAATASAGAAPPAEASAKPAAAKSNAAKASALRARAASPVEKAVRSLDVTGVVAGLVRALGLTRATTTRLTSVAGYATAATASKTGALAFLSDPKLSIEEKLIKLMGYLNAKWEKEMQDKLEQIKAKEGTAANASSTSTSSSTAKTKKKGLLGSIASAFSSALGGAAGAVGLLKIPAVKTALKKLGGPVLAAAASAFGFPAAAPVLLKYGPTVVDAAMGVASAVGGTSTKTSQAASGSGATSDSTTQTIMMEIQRIQSKQQEMFNLVSNILKSGHDTRMSMIGNLR